MQKGSARGSVHWGCYYATALDIEVDPQRGRFGSRKSDFALQALVECRALEPCVDCFFFSGHRTRPLTGSPSCSKREAYPDPPPVVPHPESLAAVSRSTCPPLPSPPREQLYNRSYRNKTHTPAWKLFGPEPDPGNRALNSRGISQRPLFILMST